MEEKIFYPKVRIAKDHEKSTFVRFLVPRKEKSPGRKRKRKNSKTKKRQSEPKKRRKTTKKAPNLLKATVNRKNAKLLDNSPPLKRRRRSRNFSSRKRNGTICTGSKRSSFSGLRVSDLKFDGKFQTEINANKSRTFEGNIATPRRKEEKIALNKTPDAIADSPNSISGTNIKQNLTQTTLPIGTRRKNRKSIEIKISSPLNHSKYSDLDHSSEFPFAAFMTKKRPSKKNEKKFLPGSKVKKKRSPQYIKPIFVAPLPGSVPNFSKKLASKSVAKTRKSVKSTKEKKSKIRRIKPEFLGAFTPVKETEGKKKKQKKRKGKSEVKA